MNERACEHWGMAFRIIGRNVLVKCTNCKKHASLSLDGTDGFTTNWAKMALNGQGKMLRDAINPPLQGEGA